MPAKKKTYVPSKKLFDSDDGGTCGVNNAIRPTIKMPSQPIPIHVINVCVKAEIGLAVNVDLVESHENVRVLPELNVPKCDAFGRLEPGLTWRSNLLCTDRGAKDALAVLGIRNPTHLRGIKDCVSPRLDVERKPILIDVRDACLETPIFATIEVERVEKGEYFGRGAERALKVDAHRGGGA